jgi:hypothetical protein
MGGKVNKEPYDFSKDYKDLPVKKRVGIIKIARNLLKLQKENNALLADAPPIENEGENKA